MGRRRWWWLTGALAVVGFAALAEPDRWPPRSSCPLAVLFVSKSDGWIELRCAGVVAARGPAVFGAAPRGHKLEEGDERTPEGVYAVVEKRPSRRFGHFLLLSYPGPEGRRRARRLGVSPGGAIGIHGVRASLAGFARAGIRVWTGLGLAGVTGPTDGCIGVANELVELIDRLAPLGTPVVISP